MGRGILDGIWPGAAKTTSGGPTKERGGECQIAVQKTALLVGGGCAAPHKSQELCIKVHLSAASKRTRACWLQHPIQNSVAGPQPIGSRRRARNGTPGRINPSALARPHHNREAGRGFEYTHHSARATKMSIAGRSGPCGHAAPARKAQSPRAAARRTATVPTGYPEASCGPDLAARLPGRGTSSRGGCGWTQSFFGGPGALLLYGERYDAVGCAGPTWSAVGDERPDHLRRWRCSGCGVVCPSVAAPFLPVSFTASIMRLVRSSVCSVAASDGGVCVSDREWWIFAYVHLIAATLYVLALRKLGRANKVQLPQTRPLSQASRTCSSSSTAKSSYFAGTNSYWLPFLQNTADIDTVFSHLQQSNLNVLRIWGYADINSIPTDGSIWFHYLAKTGSQINTGPNGLQRLDYVIKSATAHNIKLIVGFMNNWSSIGVYNNAFGGNSTSWYTDAASQQAYRDYINAVVTRYKGNPAIFAWELGNEPRCKGCSTDVVYNWAKSTSAYIKTLEPARMVCIGDGKLTSGRLVLFRLADSDFAEGFGLQTNNDNSYPFSYAEGIDFEKNIQIPTIDFATFHLYPDLCK